MVNEWESRVYKPPDIDPLLAAMPRGQILKRDNYTCQSCRKRLLSCQLSVHHITPRAEGGTNNACNLITLCRACHDLIELAEPPIRDKQQILYYARPTNSMHEPDAPDEMTWHAWVYGGFKNPCLNGDEPDDESV